VQVAVVNEAAARLFFGAADPIGRRIGRGAQGPFDIHVVGLVNNAKYLDVREAPRPTVYFPYRGGSPMTLHVRSATASGATLRAIEAEVRALDPGLPLFHVQTVAARVDDALRQERLVATLSAVLSVVGTVVAAIGLYGVISFTVVQRRREIGIRLAVGAEPRQVLLLVLRAALVLVAAGIVVGVPLALGAFRFVSTFLYGVPAPEPWLIAAAAALLTLVGLAAGLAPARHAARTDPVRVLRQD
jgi:ABC-type antimicrobial peptide transport system permease subunit